MTVVRELSAEARLLLQVAGPTGNDSNIRELIRQPLNWGLLFALALREHAVPALWRRLKPLAGDCVPAEVQRGLEQYSRVSDFRQLHLQQRLGETVRALLGADIEVLLLKGAALALTAYGSFPKRPMVDLDILVRAEQATAAYETASSARWQGPDTPSGGNFYAQHHHAPPLADADGTQFSLELHTDLFPRGHRFGLTPAVLWQSALAAPGMEGAQVPSTPHQLLHLALHFAWSHRMERAGWKTFRDLDAIIRTTGVDWDSFPPLARHTGAATACFWTFRLAQSLCGVCIPEQVIAELRPRGGHIFLARLERHFASMVLDHGAVCPSMRVQRWMWSLAVQPRSSGLGTSRPWDRDGVYIDEYGSDADQAPATWRHHVREWRRWGRYLAALARPDWSPAD